MATVTQRETAERTSRAAVFQVPRFVDAVILVAGALIYGVLSVRAGKEVNWDLFNYHFYNGWAAWTGRGGANIAPAQVQSFFNPAMDIPQYLAIAHLPPRLVGFLIGAIQGINIFLVFAIIRALGRLGGSLADTAIALVAAAVALSCPVGISEVGSTMGDLTLTVPILLGVLLIVRAFQSEDQRSSAWKIIAAGLCLGATAGLKYTTGPYAVAAAGALLIRPPPSLSRVETILRLFVAGVVGFLFIAGPWMIALEAHYGSPMFPFFNAWFRSPYMVPVTWFDSTYQFKTWSAILLFPFSLIHEGAHHLQFPFHSLGVPLAICCLLLSLFLGIVAHLRTAPSGRHAAIPTPLELLPAEWWLLLYFGFSYLVWAKTFGDYRYFLSSEVLAPAIVVITICQIAPWRTVRFGAVLVAALALVTFASVGSWGRLPWKASSTYFDARLPPNAPTAGTIVLMTGPQAMSFLIPYFDHGIRFVRIQSNFNGLESPKYAQMLSETISSQRGPLALLTTVQDVAESHEALKQYRVEIVVGSCEPVHSVYSPQIELCELKRT